MTREERCEMRLSECQGQSLQYTRVTYIKEILEGMQGSLRAHCTSNLDRSAVAI